MKDLTPYNGDQAVTLGNSKVKIDYAGLALGFVDLIETMPENYQAAFAFGMLPDPLMKIAEKELKRKIEPLVTSSAEGLSALGLIDKQWQKDQAEEESKHLKSLVAEAMHTLSVAVLREGKKRGIVVV